MGSGINRRQIIHNVPVPWAHMPFLKQDQFSDLPGETPLEGLSKPTPVVTQDLHEQPGKEAKSVQGEDPPTHRDSKFKNKAKDKFFLKGTEQLQPADVPAVTSEQVEPGRLPAISKISKPSKVKGSLPPAVEKTIETPNAAGDGSVDMDGSGWEPSLNASVSGGYSYRDYVLVCRRPEKRKKLAYKRQKKQPKFKFE